MGDFVDVDKSDNPLLHRFPFFSYLIAEAFGYWIYAIPDNMIQFESCIYHDGLKTSNIIWDCLPRKNCKDMQKNFCADYMDKLVEA